MQPKFTLRDLGGLGVKLTALALVFALSFQTSISQSRSAKVGETTTKNKSVDASKQQQNAEKQKAERDYINNPAFLKTISPVTNNDAGLPFTPVANRGDIPTPDAVCATFTGDLLPGDNTMPQRLNRPGGTNSGNCSGGWVFPGTFGSAGYFYETHTYTNTTGLTQCGTFTLTTTDVTNANIAFGIWDGSFNPVSLATNNIAAPNVSTGTPANTLTLDVTINAGQTIVIAVWSANPSSGASGTASNYTVTVDFPLCSSAPCSGTPTPGNTISSVATVCPGINFSLSLQNPTAGSGVSYQWQSGPSSTGPWTDIPGATGAGYSTSQSAATWYQCVVTCSGNPPATSTPVQVMLTPVSGCYCTPPASDCTDDDVILRVRISTLDNASTCGTGPPAGYTYYGGGIVPAPTLYSGAANEITVNTENVWSKALGVWIDYNQDGTFDASEYTDLGNGPAAVDEFIADINIPTTALNGLTRMRVRLKFSTTAVPPTGACTSISAFGETEDYDVNIQPCIPAVITSSPSNTSAVCGEDATFTASASGTYPSYQWQTRGDPNTVHTLTFTNNTPLAVPDNDPAGVYSTIAVSGIPAGAVITNVSIRLNIDHTYVGDMENNIIAPNGVSLNLIGELDNGSGSNSSDNFTNTVISSTGTVPLSGAPAPRTGTFRADRLSGYGPSGNFQTSPNGMPWSDLYTMLNGNWQLGLSDWYSGDVGTLNSWSITFSYTLPSVWQNIVDGGIYSGATTPTLTISPVDASMTGNQYRAIVEGGCSGPDFTNAATLTVTPIIPVVAPASASICTGTIQQLSLTNTLSVPTTAMFSKTGLSTVLTNGVANIVNETVTVSGIPAGSVITNIEWGFNMTHTWASDVGGNITSPTGENFNLFWQVGGSTDDFIGTYFDALSTADIAAAPAPRTGVFAPMAFTISGAPGFNTTTNDVNDMLVGDPNGDWTFHFYDAFGGDDGLLTDLYVNITYTAPVFAQGTWTGPAGTMWTDAAATVPYTGTPATTIYVNPTANANYQVSFMTPLCQSATATVPISVSDPVTGVVNPSSTAVCVGSDASFSVSASGGPLTYQWQVSTDAGTTWSNIAGATGTTLNLPAVAQTMNNNRYRVVISAGPCGSVNSGSATLTVNGLPNASISAGDLSLAPGQTTTVTGSSSPAASNWVWTLNGQILGGNSNTQLVDVDGMGTYQATVTDVNGCVNTTNQLVIGAEASDKLWIYPNPNSGQFQVRLFYQSNFGEKRVVSIFNSRGQLVDRKEFILSYNSAPYLRMDFDLSKHGRGVYAVKVADTYTSKIVSGLVIID